MGEDGGGRETMNEYRILPCTAASLSKQETPPPSGCALRKEFFGWDGKSRPKGQWNRFEVDD